MNWQQDVKMTDQENHKLPFTTLAAPVNTGMSCVLVGWLLDVQATDNVYLRHGPAPWVICWRGRWGGGREWMAGWICSMGDLLEEELRVGKVDGWVHQ